MISSSGIFNIIENLGSNIKIFSMYKEILPLCLLRPISGSSSMAIGLEIIKKNGVDSNIGKIASCIMGASETTIYVASIYSSKVKNKNIKPIIIIGILADCICIISVLLASKIGLI